MTLELTLKRNDEEHLNRFKSDINSNIPIAHKRMHLNGKTYDSSRITVCCTEMCRDLIDKGCIPRKSLKLHFPSSRILPNNLVKHFIRGYFDGDGCVSVKREKIIEMNFVGTSDLLNGISDFLLSEKVIYKKPTFYRKGNAWEMFIYGADSIKRIYQYLYNDTSLFLKRKKDILQNFFESYDLTRKSKSGKQGVYFDSRRNKWIASIYMNGKRIYLGAFINKEDAINKRQDFEILKYADQNSNVL